jgi:N-acetyl-anhydromuramyl-L-alanine amidase AmpD
MMFRPFTLTACVLVDEAGATFDDSQMIEIGTDRTAVSLSRNTVHARYYELSDDKKTLTIDWKPDFIKSPRLTRVWNRAIRFIILHRTGSDDMKSTLDKFVQPIGQGLPGSAHYVIDQDGFVVRMVQDEYGSHHTPRGHNYTYPEDGSFWRGRDDVQDSSIGIEVVAAPLGSIEDPQLNSLSSLVREIRHALAIPAKDVAGHIDVRLLGRISYGLLIGGTSCPNLSFPWYALGQRNATIRYQNEHDNEFNGEIEAKYGSVLPDDPAWAYNGSFTSAMWTQLASDLKEIGYSINRNDGVTTDPPEYDAIRQALFVFRYRFHGESIIGSLDRRLAATIESVLANIRNG